MRSAVDQSNPGLKNEVSMIRPSATDRKTVPGLRRDLHQEISRRATEEQIRESERWLADHERDIQDREDYGTIRVSSNADCRALLESASPAIDAEIEELKAAVPQRQRPRTEISGEAVDQFIEPYLAIRGGMPLEEVAKTFGVTDAARHLASVELWLTLLASRNSSFNRAEFLAKCGKVIEKRKRDAQIGAKRAAARKVVIPEPAEEHPGSRPPFSLAGQPGLDGTQA